MSELEHVFVYTAKNVTKVRSFLHSQLHHVDFLSFLVNSFYSEAHEISAVTKTIPFISGKPLSCGIME